MLKIFFFFIFFHLGVGCVTYSGTVEIVSYPAGAEVYLKRPETPRLLGTTPLSLQLSSIASDRDLFLTFEISEEDYQKQLIIIPSKLGDFSHKITVDLVAVEKQEIASTSTNSNIAALPQVVCPKIEIPKLDNQCEILSKQKMTHLAEGVAVVQSFIQKKEYEIATMKLSSLISEYTNISVLYDLQGNIRYLQKDFGNALTAYRKSLDLNPQNSQTADIVKQLEQSSGGSSMGAH